LASCTSNGTCEESDPNICPPHSDFHPLPTRPVFSPPQSIPGVYTPWPGGEEVIPGNNKPLPPADAVEVRNRLKSGNSDLPSNVVATAPDDWHATQPEPPGWHSPLRR